MFETTKVTKGIGLLLESKEIFVTGGLIILFFQKRSLIHNEQGLNIKL